jgi:hypothetical protein
VGIKISGITEEALSKSSGNATSLGAIPAGSYNATVFDVKQEEVRSGPNEGKPRFNVQFRISDGEYENRRVFSYVALYVAGDFWKTQSFFKALGYDMKSGDFEVPSPEELMGKSIGVRVKVGKDQNGEDRNEVAGFDKATASTESVLSSLGAVPAGDVWV